MPDYSTVLRMLWHDWCYGPKLPVKGVPKGGNTAPSVYLLYSVTG